MRSESDKYIAIIGDLVGSRSSGERRELQKRLVSAINDINRVFHERIEADFVITSGDEFQGLTKDLESAYAICDELKYALHPQKLRFGIGYGRLVVFPDDKSKALGYDGEAFWRARAAIEDAHKREVSIAFATGDDWNSLLFAAQIGLEIIWKKRTETQTKVIKLYRKNLTQKAIADEFSVSQQAVGRRLETVFIGKRNSLSLQ